MKATELIAKLQALVDEFGDLPIAVEYDGHMCRPDDPWYGDESIGDDEIEVGLGHPPFIVIG